MELLIIGTELVVGASHDTNGTWLGERLAREGVRVTRRTVVADDPADIRAALAGALRRSHAVICTGGLGSTVDDVTRDVVAALYGAPLELDEGWLHELEQRFARRGLTMPAANRTQALVPRGAIRLDNPRGTAPGLLLRKEALGVTFVLPGVPAELRALVEEHVVPYLAAQVGADGPGGDAAARPILHRVLRTTGTPESAIADRLADVVHDVAPLTIAFLPHITGVDIRFTCWGDIGADERESRFAAAEAVVRARLPDHVYGRDDEDLAALVGDQLRDRGFTIALAESCTGGLLAKRLTDRAGSSAYVMAGLVTYSNEAKQRLLGVRAQTLAQHGAVSEECAREMAVGARREVGTDVALSITGVAGPGGGSADKPVGTVWIGCAVHDEVSTRLVRLAGDRADIRERAAQAALDTLRLRLRVAPAPPPPTGRRPDAPRAPRAGGKE